MNGDRDSLDGRDYRIIREMARQGLMVTEVGYAVHMHRNTVLYHLDKIKRITGYDPRDYYGLTELLRRLDGAVVPGRERDHNTDEMIFCNGQQARSEEIINLIMERMVNVTGCCHRIMSELIESIQKM